MKKKEAQTAAIDFVRRLAGHFDQEPRVYVSRIILYRDGLAPGADGATRFSGGSKWGLSETANHPRQNLRGLHLWRD